MTEPKPLGKDLYMTVRFLVTIQYDYHDTDTPTLKRSLEDGWRQKIQATLQPHLYPGLKLDVQVSGNPAHAISSVSTSAANPKSRKLSPVLVKAFKPASRKKINASK